MKIWDQSLIKTIYFLPKKTGTLAFLNFCSIFVPKIFQIPSYSKEHSEESLQLCLLNGGIDVVMRGGKKLL